MRIHIFISGRVQGVFFRAWTQEKAEELGLTGWVRNLDDARVEAFFEGPKEKVEKMVGWCWKGPEGAEVKKVEKVDLSRISRAEVEKLKGLEIRY